MTSLIDMLLRRLSELIGSNESVRERLLAVSRHGGAGAGAGMYLHNISTQCPKKDNTGQREEWGRRNLRMSPTPTPAMANQQHTEQTYWGPRHR